MKKKLLGASTALGLGFTMLMWVKNPPGLPTEPKIGISTPKEKEEPKKTEYFYSYYKNLMESKKTTPLTKLTPSKKTTPLVKLTGAKPIKKTIPGTKLTGAKPVKKTTPLTKLTKAKKIATPNPNPDPYPITPEFKAFMSSKEKWMEEHVIWEQWRMGYSTWDRDPEFFGWVIWIDKPGQFKTFFDWLKRLGVYKK